MTVKIRYSDSKMYEYYWLRARFGVREYIRDGELFCVLRLPKGTKLIERSHWLRTYELPGGAALQIVHPSLTFHWFPTVTR